MTITEHLRSLKLQWPGPMADMLRPECLAETIDGVAMLAALATMGKGSFRYGTTTRGPEVCPYGRDGLEMGEAMLIRDLTNFVEGWLTGLGAAGEQQRKELYDALDTELAAITARAT